MAKKYQNPILQFNADDPAWKKNLKMDFNLALNRILPVWLLQLLNPNKTIRNWQKKQRKNNV